MASVSIAQAQPAADGHAITPGSLPGTPEPRSVITPGPIDGRWSWWTRWIWPTHAQALAASEAELLASLCSVPYTKQFIAGQNTLRFAAPYDGAPKLIMLHGYAAGSALYGGTIEHLSKHFEVYAVDWLGCGASERPAWTAKNLHEAESFFTDSLAVLKEHISPGTPITMLGHSMGGYLLAEYAQRHPDHVSHVILASPVGLPPPPEETGVDEALAGRQRSWIFRTLKSAWEGGTTPQALVRGVGPLGPGLTRRVIHARFSRTNMLVPADLDVMSKYMYHISAAAGSGEHVLSAVLAPGAWAHHPMGLRLADAARSGSMRMPVTFMYGGSHDWMNPKTGRACAAMLREAGVDSTVELVEHSGHQLFLENPAGFAAAVLRRDARVNPEHHREPAAALTAADELLALSRRQAQAAYERAIAAAVAEQAARQGTPGAAPVQAAPTPTADEVVGPMDEALAVQAARETAMQEAR